MIFDKYFKYLLLLHCKTLVYMTREDILTIKAVMLYIIKNSSPERRDVYSIVKTAYYAQQFHFAKWASPIFKDRIAALPFGPVPSMIYNVLRLARGEERERIFLQKYGLDAVADVISFENESFSNMEDPDLDYLSETDIECLDEAISKVASMDFGKIVKDTHGKEWQRAFKSKNKTMDDLSIAREGGASEDILN